jgi:hypothetical protein
MLRGASLLPPGLGILGFSLSLLGFSFVLAFGGLLSRLTFLVVETY